MIKITVEKQDGEISTWTQELNSLPASIIQKVARRKKWTGGRVQDVSIFIGNDRVHMEDQGSYTNILQP